MPGRKGEAEPTEEGREERGRLTPLIWSGSQGGPHGGGEARAHLKGGSRSNNQNETRNRL